MTAVLTQNVLICPSCKAMMHRGYRMVPGKPHPVLCFTCVDCKDIWIIMDLGQSENELIVTDSLEEYLKETNDEDNN